MMDFDDSLCDRRDVAASKEQGNDQDVLSISKSLHPKRASVQLTCCISLSVDELTPLSSKSVDELATTSSMILP